MDSVALPEQIEELRSATAKIVDDLLEHELEFHRTNVVPAQVEQVLREVGFYSLRIPEEYGGSAVGMLASAAVNMELGRLPPQFWPYLRVAFGPTTKALVLHGSTAQKERWLPAIGSGECGVSFVLTEPEAGSDLAAMKTRAERVDGGYRLNGSKTYISNAANADLFLVFARTDPEKRLKGGISTFLIPSGRKGLTVSPPMPTMGSTLHGLYEVHFEDCFVPAEDLLGTEGDGFLYAMESLNEGRLNVGAIAIAMGQMAVDLTIEHTKERVVQGKPLAINQVVQHMIVNAQIDLHAGRLMLLDAARNIDAGVDASAAAAMVKIFCTEAASRAIDTAVQLFGAAGLIRGVQVERLYRDIRSLRIYEGASEVLRNFVGRKLFSS